MRMARQVPTPAEGTQEGYGHYLDHLGTHSDMRITLHCTLTTFDDELNLAAKDIKDCLAFNTLDGDAATHVSLVEYGHVDDRLYCDCGASPFDAWELKCNDQSHGSIWARYNGDVLMPLLKRLEPFEELNILGVGKSTWINAIQISDSCGRFVQKDIKIGSNQSEHDGARGQSATQSTSVYAVNIGNTRIRLIDTLGIGDTRGLEQDNKNMADILRVPRTYNHLHGILILLKPNAARLTMMFRFCVKQLLTHLHRNATNNIAFGFTNTRGSKLQTRRHIQTA
ncbi:hypothetical protein B0T25DRAFT_580173 [Lasiosphaeria hispida]|uniref:Uncharacterized protein n=1 Tax=Lasiosphaeria hispida TaxID=260671 RepID=A0AAJ0HGJ4_9PEZI|nr:hypothetical protein B0T25DRAFT_580173 [Lasiosphaeria hispida]